MAETRAKLIQRKEGVEAPEMSEAAEGKIKGHGAKRRFFQSAHRVGLHMGPSFMCRWSALKRCLDCVIVGARMKAAFLRVDGGVSEEVCK